MNKKDQGTSEKQRTADRDKLEDQKHKDEALRRLNPQDATKNKDQQNVSEAAQKQTDSKTKKSGRKAPQDSTGDPNNRPYDAVRWGDLPAKLHHDAEKVRGDKVPERWRDEIEKYRQATSD